MSFNAQVKQIAEEAVDGVKADLVKALKAAEERIAALEARLGGDGADPDVAETAAKAPRRGRKPAADPAEQPADTVAEAVPAAATADTKSTGA